MHTSDYWLIANVFYAETIKHVGNEDAYYALFSCARELATALEAENLLFKRKLFLDACGFSSHTHDGSEGPEV